MGVAGPGQCRPGGTRYRIQLRPEMGKWVLSMAREGPTGLDRVNGLIPLNDCRVKDIKTVKGNYYVYYS